MRTGILLLTCRCQRLRPLNTAPCRLVGVDYAGGQNQHWAVMAGRKVHPKTGLREQVRWSLRPGGDLHLTQSWKLPHVCCVNPYSAVVSPYP